MIYLILTIILNLGVLENVGFNVNGTQDRIYNGIPALDAQFPYMVLIISGLYQPNKTLIGVCSGSLIGYDTILTAAHCFRGKTPAMVVVMVGQADARSYLRHRITKPFNIKFPSSTLQESIASRIHVHPNFNRGFDMAIVKISKPFVKTDFVGAMPYTLENYPGDLLCVRPGYGENNAREVGRLSYFHTRQVLTDLRQCGFATALPFFYCINHKTPTSPSTCVGDSGSPLVCNDKIYGVHHSVNYYKFAGQQRRCGALGAMKILRLSQSEGDSLFLAIYSEKISSKSNQLLPQFYVLITVVLLSCLQIISF